jgi:Protein phosphatase 2C
VNDGNFYAIGDPGRAARETPDGPPPALIGLADVELSMASLPGMVIRAASSRGLHHRARRLVRQDAYALGRRALDGEPQHAVVTVCDGVGSLECSHYAAALVSQRLATHAATGIDWWRAFAFANEELTKTVAEWEAAGRGGMATTAVAVTVRRDGDVWAGEAAWVGDSTLWHLGDDLRWTLISGSSLRDEGGYHSSGVRPMPTQDASWAWCSFRIRGGALFAMTDGVGNPLMWSPQVRATLADWWARSPDPFTFAAQIGFAKKTHMDDRTVVGIWPDWKDEDAGQENGSGNS